GQPVDFRYSPLPAALLPSLIASASVMYLPFFVLPQKRDPSLWYTCDSVLTQTSPCPPPGAGGLDAAAALAFFAGALLTAAGLADAEVFGLNNSPSENLEGDGEGVVAVAALLRPPFCLRFPARPPNGLPVGPAWVSLRPRYAVLQTAADP